MLQLIFWQSQLSFVFIAEKLHIWLLLSVLEHGDFETWRLLTLRDFEPCDIYDPAIFMTLRDF